MNPKDWLAKPWLRRGMCAGLAAALTFSVSTIALAQEEADEAPAGAEVVEEAESEDASEDTIVVTGSRIARDEFTSPAPLQSLDPGAARQLGITSLTELLQRTTVANGQQVDRTLNTNAGNSNAAEPPPLGGVGSANIGLRGLDPERTLILINNRRLGSAGVRGAPAQPDLNLLPLSLVERVEVVTEGASAIYGADAVAGVVNVILRDEFEGLEVSFNYEAPEAAGGNSFQASFLTGATGSRGRFLFGGEFYSQDRVALGDRIDCRLDLVQEVATGRRMQECLNGFFDNAAAEFVTNNPTGDIFFFHIPGLSAADSDVGIANWGSALMLPLETEFDGACERLDQRCRFQYIPFYNDENERLRSDLVQPITRFSTVALGSYDLNLFDVRSEAYFEAYYFNRTTDNHGAIEQIFPTIPGMIMQEELVDALDANGNPIPILDEDGNPTGEFVQQTVIVVDAEGRPILVDNPLNPFPGNVSLIVTLDDFASQDRDVEVSQFRFVGGLRGDIPGLGESWKYDTFFSYDRGTGFQTQPLMNETNLNIALNTLRVNADGELICGVTTAVNDFGFITGQGPLPLSGNCVPVNFFADSIFTGGANGDGAFETDAERRYLIGQRLNHTIVEQTMAALYFTGDLFDLPAGTVSTAFGGEIRFDRIKSAADFLSAVGENAGENPGTEEPTIGKRWIWDVYGEVYVPVLDNTVVGDFSVEGAVRYTEEENFGSASTYRARATYSPLDWLTLSGSFGTSFRAPNLREAFLAPQLQGVGSAADPCGVPAEANVGGVYIPANDTRSQTVLDNCILAGVNPFELGLVANINIPVTVGGNALELDPETSKAFTATLRASPPISDDFKVDLAVSWYQITVSDNIRSIAPVSIMDQCYNSQNLSHPFCSRLTRADNPGENFDFINFIDASFVNVGEEVSEGVDINTRFSTEFGPVNFVWSGVATFLLERTEHIFPDDPTDEIDDLVGDFGFPEISAQSAFSFGYSAWELLFDLRWFDTTFPGREALENMSTQFNCAGIPNANPGGPNTNYPGSPQTFRICEAEGPIYVDTALTYRGDGFLITGGINNLFNHEPPLVHRTAGSNRGGLVTSSGYDQIGRSYYIVLTKQF